LDLLFFLASLSLFSRNLILHFVFVYQKVHQGADIRSQGAFGFADRFSANTKFLKYRSMLFNDAPGDGDPFSKNSSLMLSLACARQALLTDFDSFLFCG
jgi:hypothetical protein